MPPTFWGDKTLGISVRPFLLRDKGHGLPPDNSKGTATTYIIVYARTKLKGCFGWARAPDTHHIGKRQQLFHDYCINW